MSLKEFVQKPFEPEMAKIFKDSFFVAFNLNKNNDLKDLVSFSKYKEIHLCITKEHIAQMIKTYNYNQIRALIDCNICCIRFRDQLDNELIDFLRESIDKNILKNEP